MLNQLKAWWKDRTPAFRSAINTQWQVALGIFAPTVLGVTTKLIDFVGGEGDFALDDVAVVGKAFVAATGSVLIAAITYAFRRVKPPSYNPAEQPTVTEVTAPK